MLEATISKRRTQKEKSPSVLPRVDDMAVGVKKVITRKRNEIQEAKMEAGKLGEETVAFIPEEDIEVMFAAENVINLIKQEVQSENKLKALYRTYPEITDDLKNRLKAQTEIFAQNREIAKKQITKIVEKHPLWKQFEPIKGFTPYQLGILMGLIKDPTKFATPGKLMMYAGLGVWKGLPVTKMHLNKIKDGYLNEGREFKGFNTMFGGRMEVITDCLMRGGGWFYDFYNRKKTYKIEKARNTQLNVSEPGVIEVDNQGQITATPNGRFCFVATKEDHKASNGVMEVGKEYMWGKKNQSLVSFADRTAKKSMKRILLHLVYSKWLEHKGITPRIPYAIEYLGHNHHIKLEEITNYDSNFKRPAKTKPAKPE